MLCDDDKVDPSPNETGPKSPHISKRWNGELFGVGCGIFPVIAESGGRLPAGFAPVRLFRSKADKQINGVKGFKFPAVGKPPAR